MSEAWLDDRAIEYCETCKQHTVHCYKQKILKGTQTEKPRILIIKQCGWCQTMTRQVQEVEL